MEIHTSVVSQVVAVGFADLAQAADLLPGSEVTQGRTRLKVGKSAGPGLAGAVRFDATIRTSPVVPALRVEVVVSPWSAGRSEVAIHPVTGLGQLDSLRTKRFVRAALSVLPGLIDRLIAGVPVETPSTLELAA